MASTSSTTSTNSTRSTWGRDRRDGMRRVGVAAALAVAGAVAACSSAGSPEPTASTSVPTPSATATRRSLDAAETTRLEETLFGAVRTSGTLAVRYVSTPGATTPSTGGGERGTTVRLDVRQTETPRQSVTTDGETAPRRVQIGTHTWVVRPPRTAGNTVAPVEYETGTAAGDVASMLRSTLMLSGNPGADRAELIGEEADTTTYRLRPASTPPGAAVDLRVNTDTGRIEKITVTDEDETPESATVAYGEDMTIQPPTDAPGTATPSS